MLDALRNKIDRKLQELHQIHNISFLGMDIDVHELRHKYRLTLLCPTPDGYARSPYNKDHIVKFLGYKNLCCDSVLPNCVIELTEMKEEKLVWNLRKEDADNSSNFYHNNFDVNVSCCFEDNPSYLKM